MLRDMPRDMEIDYGIGDDGTFGLWHTLNYAIETWQHYREYGTFPYPGSYNDQPQIWVDDKNALSKRLSLHWVAAMSEKREG